MKVVAVPNGNGIGQWVRVGDWNRRRGGVSSGVMTHEIHRFCHSRKDYVNHGSTAMIRDKGVGFIRENRRNL